MTTSRSNELETCGGHHSFQDHITPPEIMPLGWIPVSVMWGRACTKCGITWEAFIGEPSQQEYEDSLRSWIEDWEV